MKNESEVEENKGLEKEKRKWGESRKNQSGRGENVREVKFIQKESGGEQREKF